MDDYNNNYWVIELIDFTKFFFSIYFFPLSDDKVGPTMSFIGRIDNRIRCSSIYYRYTVSKVDYMHSLIRMSTNIRRG